MAKPKQPQEPRVLGVYKKTDDRYEIRYVDPTGKQRSKYRNQKRAADALAKQIAATIRSDMAAVDTSGWDPFALLKKIALCATEAGDYAAATSAIKASVIFTPPAPAEDKFAHLTKLGRDELIAEFITALEDEGYEIKKK